MSSLKNIFIIAGEASGDMHAAHLVQALRARDSNLTFSGVGGPLMRQAGVELYEDLTKIAVVGFVEILKHFGEFRRIFHVILAKVKKTQTAAVILIDYPGFNLRLAKELKKLNVKVIYYISPQVWAWKENRVETIKKYVDKMLVLFEFEKKFYAQRGLAVEFVGHPFIDTIKIKKTKQEFLQSDWFSDQKVTIGILPGSRHKEIENLLPPMIEAARILNREFSGKVQFLLLQAPTIPREWLQKYLNNDFLVSTDDAPLRLIIVDNQTYDGINASDVCMVASGTATLETAILNKPMVVVYKTSPLTYWLARRLIKIPYIAMANVVAGKKIIPECIQQEATGERIAQELKNIFTDEMLMTKIKSELKKVKESLGGPGAIGRAAKCILEFLD